MIIYLNGTSSSGKSSIALELQKLITKPVMYFSIDTLLYSLSPEFLEAMQGKREYPSEVSWGDIFDGYFGCLLALVNANHVIIGDCPVYRKDIFDKFNLLVKAKVKLLTVGLDCSLETLNIREKNRKDRAIGLAERQYASIHDFLSYSYRVNTEKIQPESIALNIINEVNASLSLG